MDYLVSVAAFVVGCIVTFILLFAIIRVNNRRRKPRKITIDPPQDKRKFEFSKALILLVLGTYFVGVYIGAKIVLIDFSQLGVFLAFVGTPTPIVIGFYIWKAKAENIIKIKKSNPTETEGIPIDLNNIST